MKQKVLYPKVVRGGKAVPLGNNFYYMSGRKHKDGGIDVGSNPRTGLEVEDEEVMHITPKEAKVFSSVPFLDGKSPAQKVLGGEDANKVFRQQENFKDRNGLNDDGSKKKEYGGTSMIRKKKIGGGREVNRPFRGDDNIATPFSVYGYDLNANDPDSSKQIDFNTNLVGSSQADSVPSSTGEPNDTTKGMVGNILSNIKTGANKVGSAIKKGAGVAGAAVKTYVEDSPGDAIGIGGNVIGGLISAGINKRMLKNLKYANAPAARQATKLKTTININPQVDKMRETLASYERDIDNNTGSSRVALARKQRARLAGMLQTNELFSAKENAETELINKDRLNQQAVAEANLQDHNRWAENKSQFENAVREKRAENKVGILENINSAIQDGITRGDRRRATEQNIIAIAAANPNVNPQMLEDLGVKLPKGFKERFNKVYAKRNANKDTGSN